MTGSSMINLGFTMKAKLLDQMLSLRLREVHTSTLLRSTSRAYCAAAAAFLLLINSPNGTSSSS